MTDRTRTVRALAVASLSVGALVSAPALAGAQAGADTTTKVVVVDSTDIAVTVNAHDGTPDTVTGSIQNRTGTEMKCQGPVGTGDTTGDVTQADIVASAMEYYKQYPWQPPIEVGVAVPIAGTYKVDLGSVETYIPAAIAGYLRPDMGMRREIGDRYTAARLIGQAGQITSLTIPANTSRTWTATLGDPTAGARQDFQIGAFFTCTDSTGQVYAFAGYEGGTAPAIGGSGSAGGGSLPNMGSLPTGSSGS